MNQDHRQTIVIKELSELENVATALLKFAVDSTCFLFYGEIGAGKTTLVKQLCQQLGVQQSANSPTFSLINEYTYEVSGEEKLAYHIDLYRLDTVEEALDIGIEDYLYSKAYCFVEWPELVEAIAPENSVKIKIEISDNSTRKFIFL